MRRDPGIRRLSLLALSFATSCAAPLSTPPTDAGSDAAGCLDDDPLTHASWVGFCEDRIDDNCRIDDERCATPGQQYCATGDEPCPATQPASGPPAWRCEGPPPENVIAFASASDDANPQVRSLCAYVYESEAVPGEHYAAVAVVDGSDARGPDDACRVDVGLRRYAFFSDLDSGEGCPDVVVPFPRPVEEQPLSNRCRKAIRNLALQDARFDPDIQYFAASREEALAKLAVLESAEVACLGVDSSAPYRDDQPFVVQARATFVVVP